MKLVHLLGILLIILILAGCTTQSSKTAPSATQASQPLPTTPAQTPMPPTQVEPQVPPAPAPVAQTQGDSTWFSDKSTNLTFEYPQNLSEYLISYKVYGDGYAEFSIEQYHEDQRIMLHYFDFSKLPDALPSYLEKYNLTASELPLDEIRVDIYNDSFNQITGVEVTNLRRLVRKNFFETSFEFSTNVDGKKFEGVGFVAYMPLENAIVHGRVLAKTKENAQSIYEQVIHSMTFKCIPSEEKEC